MESFKERLINLRGFFNIYISKEVIKSIRGDSVIDTHHRRYMEYSTMEEKEQLLDEKFKDCEKLSANTPPTHFVTYIFPMLVNVPLLVLTIINPCLTYATPLYITIVSIFSLCYFVSYVDVCIYNRYIMFCTWNSLYVHNIHIMAFNLMLACTLGYYNLYSYDANIGYFLGAGISGTGALFEFFICIFFRDHFYACISEGCGKPVSKKIMCFKAVEDCLTTLGVMFTLFWMGFLIAPVVLQRYLYYYDDVTRPEAQCYPIV